MNKRSFLRAIFFLIVSIIALTVWANLYVINKSAGYLFNDVKEVPSSQAGLLLGTSKLLKSGISNLYFANRINATVNLFKAGKIKYIIISGDNSKKNYNEPQDMKEELIKNGIPDTVIYLDYAGFRTFDSVIRANKIFGQSQFICISQKFHNERAVFIARNNGIKAYGYNAQDVNAYMGIKTKAREIFARVKVFVDMVTNKEPRFLGEPVNVGSMVTD